MTEKLGGREEEGNSNKFYDTDSILHLAANKKTAEARINQKINNLLTRFEARRKSQTEN